MGLRSARFGSLKAGGVRGEISVMLEGSTEAENRFPGMVSVYQLRRNIPETVEGDMKPMRDALLNFMVLTGLLSRCYQNDVGLFSSAIMM